MSLEYQILFEDCFLCGLPLEVNRMIKVGDYLLCHACAKRLFEVVRQWLRKDVFGY